MENLFGEEIAERAAPVAPYLGGKSQLASTLVQRIHQVPHEVYAEVFFGMGGVFYRRDVKACVEVVNDINVELVTFLRVLRNHPQALTDELDGWVTSREEFEAMKASNTRHLTDIQRAARFIYLQRLAFGGKVTGQTFGVAGDRGARFKSDDIRVSLNLAAQRLRHVIVENLDWRDLIRRYDAANVLFYLDPPYWGGENDYGKGIFARKDFGEMAEILMTIEGRFLLSINDTPEIREIFKSFEFKPVELKYSISKQAQTNAHELIISN